MREGGEAVNPYVVAAVFARGGSKGIPRKNTKLLAGKPLLAYSIEVGLASRLVDRVIVSTDDREIADIALLYGAEVPFIRPSELAQDDSPEWLAWRHAIQALESDAQAPRIDVLVSLPPTAPLRSVCDVDACIRRLLESRCDAVIVVTPAERNPYFNMVVMETDKVRLAIQGERPYVRRQDAPPVYDVTTVAYAARPEFVMRAGSLFEGDVRAVVVPPERAVDIDAELDLKFAEFLLKERGCGQ